MSSQVYLVARNLPIIRENYYYFKVILGLFQLFMWVKYWKVTTAVMLLLTLLCPITCPLLNKKTAWSSKWIMLTAKSDQNFAGKGIALWENHLLRCWDCLSINWIGTLTVWSLDCFYEVLSPEIALYFYEFIMQGDSVKKCTWTSFSKSALGFLYQIHAIFETSAPYQRHRCLKSAISCFQY